VCHISSPLSNLIFSSLLNCSRRASGSSSALTSTFPATAGSVSESIVLEIGKGVGISVLTGILLVCLIIVHWCDILTSVKYRRDDLLSRKAPRPWSERIKESLGIIRVRLLSCRPLIELFHDKGFIS
jgi:hypothetical protein